ncbi:MAG: DUF268 domain-containing protein [Saprospiraceae bacterium]
MSNNRFSLHWYSIYPCLQDKSKMTGFDHHYLYHPAWAARVLAQTKPRLHIDISSILNFSTIVSAFIPMEFYDYRPAEIKLSNYNSNSIDLKNLKFADESISSVSCMHTIEHVGLGRYGDALDPDGDLKSIQELKRVLKKGGNLLFVTPIGKPKIEFNAHRIYSYEQIMSYFEPLSLKQFSLIPDQGGLIESADPLLVKDQNYACGCFWFQK